jgi:hypothetical protein
MANYDSNESTYEAYADRLRERVDVATEQIRRAFSQLKSAERADPQVWESLLRRARRAYRSIIPRSRDIEDAQRVIRDIEGHQVRAVREDRPDLNRNLGLPVSTRLEFLQDQLDSMRALIEDYYARLSDPPTDDDGNIAFAALGSAVAASAGIFRRRSRFYARDQSGRIYNEASRVIQRQAGARSYIWLRTTSANPRDRHLRRVGNEYEYGEVPDEPGDLPNCKCGRKPVYEDNETSNSPGRAGLRSPA